MSTSEPQPSELLPVKWVGKIALLVALVSAAGLLAAITWATDAQGSNYSAIVMSTSLTQQKLGPVMLVFGLLSVTVAALATWLISLYSSHRIAGPLFRFAQNLKTILQDPFARPLSIRVGDALQQEWIEFETAQAHLREHYGALRDALADCRKVPSGEALPQALARLQEVEHRGQL
ncbi:MAG: hypothetical protein COW02_17485 [Comamonadaceae bacterium CG12_big_fil_rev_8_21_14_0_65_59_15]|nr:MAG: hypothetical protein COW02_17485 [Comamonadaceae bacterium CG12_big_fil_rev_8_21_14_0_65_59_15]